MRTMKAALYQGNRKLEIKDIAVPEVGPGEVLTRVRAEGVCGSDLLLWWDKPEPEDIPGGHEVAGEIVEVGEGVDGRDRRGRGGRRSWPRRRARCRRNPWLRTQLRGLFLLPPGTASAVP